MSITRALLWLLILVSWTTVGWAQTSSDELALPKLSGRVVDQAQLLSPAAETRLTQMLNAHEQATSEQVVVVTVPSLQGRSIEEFGVALGRAWGIGQKAEDNGALLIVARDDRRMRIEVGYGLEGRLTDAQSSIIINSILTPAFRQGQFEQGIIAGAAAIIQVLGGDPLQTPENAEPPPASTLGGLVFFFIIIVLLLGGGRGGRGGSGRALLAGALLGGMGGGSRGGGGGFGGGGGGFGGGGASGGW